MKAERDEEFREFMHGRWPVMVRLAYALTGDQGHAEEVAQTAFAKAYANWPRVTRAGDPDAYIRQIVINENRNRFRKRRVRELSSDNLPDTPIPGIDLDSRAALLDALKALGPRQRAVVVLRYWLDLTETETATALGCSVGTVKSQASRALATLRTNAHLVEGNPR
jgi:RNA polymerase sigma-70 factor (sigma-E family)